MKPLANSSSIAALAFSEFAYVRFSIAIVAPLSVLTPAAAFSPHCVAAVRNRRRDIVRRRRTGVEISCHI